MMLIDPMVISNTAAGGVIAFGTGPALWAMTLALFGSAAAAIIVAARPFRSARRRAVGAARPLRLTPASAAVK